MSVRIYTSTNLNSNNYKDLIPGRYNFNDLKNKGLITNTSNNIIGYSIPNKSKLILKVYKGQQLNGKHQKITKGKNKFNNNYIKKINSIIVKKITENFTQKSTIKSIEQFTQKSNNMIYYILFALFVYYIYFRRK